VGVAYFLSEALTTIGVEFGLGMRFDRVGRGRGRGLGGGASKPKRSLLKS